jgi:hypothetical protein
MLKKTQRTLTACARFGAVHFVFRRSRSDVAAHASIATEAMEEREMHASKLDRTPREVRGATGSDDPMTRRPVGDPFVENVRDDEIIHVQVLAAGDGLFGYHAQCGYMACDGPFRDSVLSTETFADPAAAMDAGVVKARQLAGIDVPEA